MEVEGKRNEFSFRGPHKSIPKDIHQPICKVTQLRVTFCRRLRKYLIFVSGNRSLSPTPARPGPISMPYGASFQGRPSCINNISAEGNNFPAESWP